MVSFITVVPIEDSFCGVESFPGLDINKSHASEIQHQRLFMWLTEQLEVKSCKHLISLEKTESGGGDECAVTLP